MSKSNIVLAILAGAVIGGIVAIVLKTEDFLFDDDEQDEEEDRISTRTGKIARQFSERISSDLQTAEVKLKSAVKKASGFISPQGDSGVFL